MCYLNHKLVWELAEGLNSQAPYTALEFIDQFPYIFFMTFLVRKLAEERKTLAKESRFRRSYVSVF